VPGMDPDWEVDLFASGGLMNHRPLLKQPDVIVEETDDYKIIRSGKGGLAKHSKRGSSIPHMLEPDLQPTREDWQRFCQFLDPHDSSRFPLDWQEKAKQFNAREVVRALITGDLFAKPREWMGIEAWSYLVYDDPALYERIIEDIADFYLAMHTKLLTVARFDFAYFHEDCCFNTGPMISPELYNKFYHKHYVCMIGAYRKLGVPLMILDSDGKVDDLIPCWLDSGFDVIFPIEVGTWRHDPVELRNRFGKSLRMFGGINKHVIPRGEAAIRRELEPLRPLVEQGGYIPIPDHRIPPDCSLEQFLTYVRLFKEIFGVMQ
ncbi:MAG: hypothetical protein FWD53_09345, partial [Phycisphaerales bacterium]|nr:hypothetical protein [Phycisphaerales bacterium]